MFQCLSKKEFEKQYKEKLSNYNQWDQKEHAKDWMLFLDNIGERLSIDEVSISNGELYTVLTNKAAKGKKNSVISMIKGTKSEDICAVLYKIPLEKRIKVTEVTLDFSPTMNLSVKTCFPNAHRVIDRFHVQKLITDSVQQVRIKKRWEALKQENDLRKQAKEDKRTFRPTTYQNGDTKKQLLARSRYLLFKPKSKWTERQNDRAVLLFNEFKEIRSAYNLSMNFRSIFEQSKTKQEAKIRLHKWYELVDEKQFETFCTVKDYIKSREQGVLNYFPNRSTNASAESFNAKIKGFRSLQRGVRDVPFFLFRLSKLYA